MRLYPKEWKGDCSLLFNVYGMDVNKTHSGASKEEVIKDGETGMVGPKSNITFSSTWDSKSNIYNQPWFHNEHELNSWVAKSNDKN